ncbi:hypothetical protein ACSBR2_012234 [Camellia fascicularis]
MKFWNESTDCGSWEGVMCDWLNGHRLNLALNDFRLSRISSKFGSFMNLAHLNLSKLFIFRLDSFKNLQPVQIDFTLFF